MPSSTPEAYQLKQEIKGLTVMLQTLNSALPIQAQGDDMRLVLICTWLIAGLVSANATAYLSHPGGCPRRAFCGCGAAVEVFGKPVRNLWLAAAWYKFPRSQPGYNTVAVRRHHVFVLKRHVGGNNWLVHDYNSGRGLSRAHVRSIAGYTIVRPT